MPVPLLTEGQIGQLAGFVADYISTQRQKALPHALPLKPAQSASMSGFFLPQLLESTRFLVLGGIRIGNPLFYPILHQLGFTNLPDFSLMAAVTFCDVVVSHEVFTAGLLFHELVHVEQYRQLGIPRFADLYVRGFLAGCGYDGIPLEVNSYQLSDRFERNPGAIFSVEREVQAWIQQGRF
jgi:hypothetical protein